MKHLAISHPILKYTQTDIGLIKPIIENKNYEKKNKKNV